MTQRFHVVVVGDGPAGTITALCLARSGWRVVLAGCELSDQARVGETLPPEINPILRNLDLWEPFLSQAPLESPGVISAWGQEIPTEIDFAHNPFGCGWHVDRNRFDRMLYRQAVEAGVAVDRGGAVGTLRKCTKTRNGWRVGDIAAEFLVDATGRNGLRMEGSAAGHREDTLLAFVVRIRGEQKSLDQRTCIETTPTGWWYSTLVSNGASIAMFFTGAEIYRRQRIVLSEQLRVARLTRSRLESALIGETQIVYVPSGYRKRMFGEAWLAVGDSASAYDPLSGRGIFKALVHGRAAAQAIDAKLRRGEDMLARYAAQVVREFEDYSQQRRRFYQMEQRWRDHCFWRERRSYATYSDAPDDVRQHSAGRTNTRSFIG